MVKRLTLPNGLRIILAPRPASVAATVLILVEAGSEYETKKINGISHFLEHLVFKGTAKRPEPGMIASELDKLGAEYNAFTGQEYTGYWAKAQHKEALKILEVVSDLYLNPIFNSAEIDRERGVIIEEINLYEDTPARRVHELFTTLLYGDQPAGWDIAGEKSVIRRVSREEIIRYRTAHYVAPATAVVVSGKFDAHEVTRRVRELFGRLGRGRKARKPKTRAHQRRPASLVKYKESDQSHLVLGARAFSVFDARRYALEVLADVLGGGMSSRLFRKVREELGAAYYVRADADLYLDHGYLAVAAGVDHLKIRRVVAIILEEMRRLTTRLVGQAELKKAQDHLAGTLLLGLETSDELASFYGGQEILTRTILSPEEFIGKIQKVGAEEVRQVARRLFRNEGLNLAVIGPYKRPQVFKKILKF